MTSFGIRDALGNDNNSVINRMDGFFPGLAEVLYLLGGSSYNQGYFDELDSRVAEGGTLEGQSKRAAGPDPEDAEDVQTEFTRPNGDVYYARTWGDFQDVDVVKRARKLSKRILFKGPPGTGKTALFEASFGTDFETFVFTADSQERDLVGQFVPNPDFGTEGEAEFIWVDGPLLRAVRNGWPILLDEIGLADAKILSVLYPLMDGRRTLYVSANPLIGEVKAAEGFYIAAATNPNAPGVVMSEALLSRFALHVEVTTDWSLALTKLGVPETVVGIAQSLNKKLGQALDWAPQMRELIDFRDIANEFGEKFAVANLIAACPNEDDREVVQEAFQRFYANALPARI